MTIPERSHPMIAPCHLRRGAIGIVVLALAAAADARDRVDLNGAWRFAIDPVRCGETNGWQQPTLNVRDWAEVQVPHCWTSDPRYPYTGAAWYRRTFSLPPGATGRQARIIFAGVFQRAKIWLNGQPIGDHEGGYTPFAFDVTASIRWSGENTLAVRADNSWNTDTLPGARIGSRPQDQVYPWLEYGGILRPVTLVLTDPVHVASQRVIVSPDIADGTAAIDITACVSNASNQPVKVRVAFTIAQTETGLAAEASIPAHSALPVTAQATLGREQVKLWDVDHPNLYTLHTRLSKICDEGATVADEPDPITFGIRKIEANNGRLLLNGEPIRMGGGNRHADHPRYGSIDPQEVIETDMRQMKRANMEFCRISHYPVSPLLLDWADRNGMLLIEEGLNWQLTEAQMDSPHIRRNFQSQMREMIERDWNHPSVIGWSVGNEYPSETPSGLRWTKDMVDFVRAIDSTRLLTFASDRAGSPKITSAENEGSRYVDLICINLYADYGKRLDRIHARWPDKPVMVSEFASPGHTKPNDGEYDDYFCRMLAAFRGRPYVVGAAVWTYNDYRSRYPGSNTDGYRHYGVVTANREPKPTYNLFASEFSPAVIENGLAAIHRTDASSIQVSCTIRARKDFPSYPLRDYTIRCQILDVAGEAIKTQTIPLPILRPGNAHTLTSAFTLAPSAWPARARIEVLRPTGFVTAAAEFDISKPTDP